MTPTQITHFATVRDALHIHGHDIPRADWDVLGGNPPVFRIDGRTYKSYAGFMRAANRIVWTLL